MLILRRFGQLGLLLMILLSAKSRPAASTYIDACHDNGPEWCCENIFCPINESLCISQGGTPGDCSWNSGTNSCDVDPCAPPE